MSAKSFANDRSRELIGREAQSPAGVRGTSRRRQHGHRMYAIFDVFERPMTGWSVRVRWWFNNLAADPSTDPGKRLATPTI
jgi:hypothetical protein